MHFLENFQNQVLKYDLINKFYNRKIHDLPQLKKIVLNFGSKKNDLKQLVSSLLAFELISSQRAFLTTTKKSNILLKIRKGQPVGCKVTLQNQSLLNFFGKMILKVFPTLKTFNNSKSIQKLKKKVFYYEIYEIFNFSELENYYYLFHNLPKLDIFVVTTAKNKEELFFVLNSFQFSLFKNKKYK